MSTEVHPTLEAALRTTPLVDHHVHGALRGATDRAGFELMLTESDWPAPPGTTHLDSQLGFAIRRWCAPLLGLEPHASAESYLAARDALGPSEVTRRLLTASGIGDYLVETGHKGEAILGVAEMAEVSGQAAHEVVRLESVLEDVARGGATATELPGRFRAVLAERTAAAVGVKSIIAYRHGFDFDPDRPTDDETVRAAGAWLRNAEATGTYRVSDPVLLRFALWTGVDRGLPIQLHAGYGDADVELHRCDPLLLTRFIKNVQPHGVDLLLLHCYPYQRGAGYLAQIFPHVYFDVGLGVNYTGARSDALIAESLELAPFSKVLFSSDAWGPPELHYLGALLWRRGMRRALGRWVDDGDWHPDEAARVVRLTGRDNARRVYGLTEAR
ncbi:amidohydrolase family protein [Streptomyces sp. RY43-2]|uniref:Amidohydrolase family protein n=1 Tax=Streptomyces macrolidinus TaxID=2952607 RepID=A0ABT0ZBD5_9ACTN|nr:amidohydrolase family protein [Streptomyces macrolidinus]MCN9241084.1 amidohydrolase family protein [Streptomyces macrolidinus]